MQHIIKLQVIEIHLGNKEDAFLMQHRMSAYYHHQIVPLLEKIFNELSGENECIQLDKIEIDLGMIDWKTVELNKPYAPLYEMLFSQINNAMTKARKEKKLTPSSAALSIAQQWLFYMQHGYLTWNTITVNDSWYEQALAAFAVDFDSVTTLRHVIQSDKIARTRIVTTHDRSFLLKLTEILTAENQSGLISVVKELSRILELILSGIGSRTSIRKEADNESLWEIVLTIAASTPTNPGPLNIAETILDELIANSAAVETIQQDGEVGKMELLPVIQRVIERKKSASSDTKTKVRAAEAGITDIENNKEVLRESPSSVGVNEPAKNNVVEKSTAKAKNENNTERSDLINVGDISVYDAGIADIANNNKEILRESTSSDVLATEPANDKVGEKGTAKAKNESNTEWPELLNLEGIFVHDAGLILLHPFLQTFFKRTGLTHHQQFLNKESQAKALHLLYYLARGTFSGEEFYLAIPKVLCGYPATKPVPKEMTLTDDEVKEADDLLEAAIAQWPILKNTSPDGLREGFLQRNGKLSSRNENLILQVESSSIDMLLDRLPWGINMIRLPWMKELLIVEWR